MTNTINKVIQNGTEYLVGGVTSVNGQQGAVTVEPGKTRLFTLASTSDLTTAQDAYDRFVNGGNPILIYGEYTYTMYANYSGSVVFSAVSGTGNVNAGYDWAYIKNIKFIKSGTSISSITTSYNTITLQSTVPTSGDNSKITFVI